MVSFPVVTEGPLVVAFPVDPALLVVIEGPLVVAFPVDPALLVVFPVTLEVVAFDEVVTDGSPLGVPVEVVTLVPEGTPA